ncbi:Nitrilotriacetate monooxygenase component B [Candidatus Paraburkholderia calva]|nr:Nitrilotriacetate monooxygenase component B [Candidatus Paraburkholderia calva]
MTRAKAKALNFDPTTFLAALGQFATGVTIITTRTDSGQLIGITASSFNSVSLDPLVLWSLATKSASMPVFRTNSHYVVNVLAAPQLELCRRFGTLKGDRFAGVSHSAGDSSMPVLDGAIAWFECHNRSRYDEGDHVIFVGEVERCGVRGQSERVPPLVFHSGDFHTLGPLESSLASIRVVSSRVRWLWPAPPRHCAPAARSMRPARPRRPSWSEARCSSRCQSRPAPCTAWKE